MNDTLLIQQVYPGGGYLPLLTRCFTRNAEYCEKFQIDYMTLCAEIDPPELGGWDKIRYVQQALERYPLVIWLDVDALIYDLSRNVKEVPTPNDSIGAVRFMIPTSHLNVGVLYFKPGDRTQRFLCDWLDRFPGEGAWHEQAVFNSLKNETVVELPAEWNLNYNYNPNARPVVMGFHGFGDAANRLKLMNKVLA